MAILSGLFRLGCAIAALGLLMTGLVVLSDGAHQYAYLIDIFTVPLTTVTCLAVVLLALLRQRFSALIALLALLCFGLSLAPDRIREGTFEDKPLRIVFANLLIRNQTPEDIIPWIEAQSPDIITLVEANHRAHKVLVPHLKPAYPYVAHRYDIYILSRYPLDHTRAEEAGFALLRSRIHTPDGPVTVAVAHLTRPWPFTSPADQRRQMQRLVSELRGEAETLILSGDFNSATYTRPMRHLRRELDLTAPAAFTGTWPAVFPGFMRIGIDHIMVGKNLSVTSRKTGPLYGSDHNPVRADVRVRTGVASD